MKKLGFTGLCLWWIWGAITLSAQNRSTYICFSLNALSERLAAGERDSLWDRLGNITYPTGVVFDSVNHDIILVGQAVRGYPPILFDDFVTALRSVHRFGEKEDPGVSIDPDTVRSGKYRVHYFADVRNTHFGLTCYKADYLLKKLEYGFPSGSPEIPNLWKQKQPLMDDKRMKYEFSSRIWFYPGLLVVDSSRYGYRLHQTQIGVGAEFKVNGLNPRMPYPLILRQLRDLDSTFAQLMTRNYDKVAAFYPELRQYKSLLALYALAKETYKRTGSDALGYWINPAGGYRVKTIKTPDEPERLGKFRSQGVEYSYQVEGAARVAVQTDPSWLGWQMLRGKAEAMRLAAEATRPNPSTVCWAMVFKDNILLTGLSQQEMEGYQYLAYGQWALRAGDAETAGKYFTRTASIAPAPIANEAAGYNALIASEEKKWGAAQSSLGRAFEKDSMLGIGWVALGNIYLQQNDTAAALHAFQKALQLNKNDPFIRDKYFIWKAISLPPAHGLAFLDSILLDRPDYCDILNLKAQLLGKLNRKPALDSLIQWAADFCPDFNRHIKPVKRQPFSGSGLSALPYELHKRFPGGEQKYTQVFDCAMELQMGYNYGQYIFPNEYFLFLPQDGSYTFTAPLSFGITRNNLLRLEVSIPFVVRSSLEINPDGYRSIGVGGGFDNVNINAFWIPFRMAIKRPYAVVQVQYSSGIYGGPTWWLDYKPEETSIIGVDSLTSFSGGVRGFFPVSEFHQFEVAGNFSKSNRAGSIAGLNYGLRGAFHIRIPNKEFLTGIRVESGFFRDLGLTKDDISKGGQVKVRDWGFRLEHEKGELGFARAKVDFGTESIGIFQVVINLKHTIFKQQKPLKI